MEIFLVWIVLSILAGIIAANKGRSGVGYFFLSVFLSPLVGLIAAFAASPLSQKLEVEQLSAGHHKKCPYCAELVRIEAIKCRHCGSDLRGSEARLDAPSSAVSVTGEPLDPSPAVTVNAAGAALRRGVPEASWVDTPINWNAELRRHKLTAAAFVALIIVGLLSTLYLAAPSGGTIGSSPGWRHVRTIGNIDMVVVDKHRDQDKDVYRAAISSICARKSQFCKVLFWNDETLVPRSMPMSATELGLMRADWVYNRTTGVRQLLWACDIEPDPAQCFKPPARR